MKKYVKEHTIHKHDVKSVPSDSQASPLELKVCSEGHEALEDSPCGGPAGPKQMEVLEKCASSIPFS